MTKKFAINDVSAILKDSVSSLTDEVVFGLVAEGKRESVFRDLFSRELTLKYPNYLAKPEWDIPPAAVARWKECTSGREKTKGIVDLALLPMSDLFTSNPTSLFEFKLWFTADALDDTKFKDETRSNDSITKSLIIDSNKMRSVRPELPGNDFIVTFLNTVHIDRISGAVDKRLAAHLKSIGVGYSNVHARPSLVSMGSDAVRSEGIKRAMREILPIAPSVTHVECGQWEWNDLKLSVDCLVNEVLPRNEALRG